jgi:hypothetical protein
MKPEQRAQLDNLLRKVIDRINQDPAKAAIILTEWSTAHAQSKTVSHATSSSHVKKKAA